MKTLFTTTDVAGRLTDHLVGAVKLAIDHVQGRLVESPADRLATQ